MACSSTRIKDVMSIPQLLADTGQFECPPRAPQPPASPSRNPASLSEQTPTTAKSALPASSETLPLTSRLSQSPEPKISSLAVDVDEGTRPALTASPASTWPQQTGLQETPPSSPLSEALSSPPEHISSPPWSHAPSPVPRTGTSQILRLEPLLLPDPYINELESPPIEPLTPIAQDQPRETPESSPLDHHSSPPGSQTTRATSVEGFGLDDSLDHEYQGSSTHPVLLVKPTSSQWADFPAILDAAKRLGAADTGCFKVRIPDDLKEPLPPRSAQDAPANAYRVRLIKRNGFFQVTTVPSQGTFSSAGDDGHDLEESPESAIKRLKKIFHKHVNRQVRGSRYRVDIPAWTAEQRREAGVPTKSPIHPLRGDKLDETRAVIPGIHTPYVYESGSAFGALFQIHAEDFRLHSLNHLYYGRKIWIVLPAWAIQTAEKAFGKKDHQCAQFMRHRTEFFFPDRLDKLGIPYRIIDQRPGETIVILPDAYHEGFSTGYTIAEAKNYAEEGWSIDTYEPCSTSCQLPTAISASLMRPLEIGQEREDLCASFEEVEAGHESEQPRREIEDQWEPGPDKVAKRRHSELGLELEDEREAKRVELALPSMVLHAR